MPKDAQNLSRHGGLNVKLPLVAPGQSVGLLGGSFNPAHEGHLSISRHALNRLNLDQVWWLVSPGNPLKSHDDLAHIDTRVKAATEVAHDRRIVVTDFERELPTPYTAATLKFLTSRLVGTNFVWLMGADNLAQIHLWQNWEMIFRLARIAVIDRPGYRMKARASRAALKYANAYVDERDAGGLAMMAPAAWTFLSVPLSSASSTALRGG